MCDEMPNCGGNGHVGPLLSQCSRAMRRALDARIAAEVTPELSGVRGMVLGDIVRANDENRNVYQRDVEQWLSIRRSSVTAILQGMEQDGFITRCAVKQDARLKSLVATEKGRACHAKIHAAIDSFEHDIMAEISQQEAEAMRGTLEKVLRNAQQITQESQKGAMNLA